MVSGSLQKDNHLDKIIESKRLQKLESVHQYFGEVSSSMFAFSEGLNIFYPSPRDHAGVCTPNKGNIS